MPQTQIIALASGRAVALEEYGAPDGRPVFFFHGWPASGVQGALIADAATELGLRILSMDRPGIGQSSQHPARRLTDWPPMLAEVADRIGVKEFRVLGVSGGSPYAFASAWALPDRVEVAAVVCGAPPLAEMTDVSALHPAYRVLLRTYRFQPLLVRALIAACRPFALGNPPGWMVNLSLRSLPAPDAEVICDPVLGPKFLANFRGAFRGSAAGVFTDATIYAEPWGFPLEDVRTPVRLWHGRQDHNFAWQTAETMARRLPACELRIVEGEGHFSLAVRRRAEILRDLRDALNS
jgi:pimeloyl-ACP methyl ester carboxylesterase